MSREIVRHGLGAGCSWNTSYDSGNGIDRDKGAPKRKRTPRLHSSRSYFVVRLKDFGGADGQQHQNGLIVASESVLPSKDV